MKLWGISILSLILWNTAYAENCTRGLDANNPNAKLMIESLSCLQSALKKSETIIKNMQLKLSSKLDIENVKLHNYDAEATGGEKIKKINSKYTFCGVSGFLFNFGGKGGNKLCEVNQNGDGTWDIRAQAESGQTLACYVRCF